MMLILSSQAARLLMDMFKALTVSTFTWEALQIFKTGQMEWLLGFVVPASYVSSKCIAYKQHYCIHVLRERKRKETQNIRKIHR